MALFQELDLKTFSGGSITDIVPGSVADEINLQSGDELLAINDQAVQDVIDVQYYGAEETLELLIRRDGELLLFEAERKYNQVLGMEFSHPTFDTDIRRCNNLCEFCFVLQMAPRFRRTLYIKDDDYRYSFLFGHYVTLTNLSEHDWWRIETMRLSPLYISVHVTDLEKRRQFLRNEKAEDILEQLRRLTAQNIDVHTQLVIVPDVNDGPWLARSIEELAALWPGVRSVTMVPVGLTAHHKYKQRTHTGNEARAIVDYVESLQTGFKAKFGVNFVNLSDEWYLVAGRPLPLSQAYDDQDLRENGLGMVRHFLDEWETVKEEIAVWTADVRAEANKPDFMSSPRPNDMPSSGWNYEKITLVTGQLFAPVLQQSAAEFAQITGAMLEVQMVTNKRLGGTITVAGLLMGQDVLDHLATVDFGDLVVLPRIMFDHPDRIALDDISPQTMANQLGCALALADTMGDLWDALVGSSRAFFFPDG